MTIKYRGYVIDVHRWRPRGGPWLTDWSIVVDEPCGEDVRYGMRQDSTTTREVVRELRAVVDLELSRDVPWFQTEEEKRLDALRYFFGSAKEIRTPSVGVGQTGRR